MANIGEGRAIRVCDLCGQVDGHARHVIAGNATDAFPKAAGELVRKVMANSTGLPQDDQDRLLSDLLDRTSSDRHLDCCAKAGCPTDTCGPQVAGAKGKTGAAMLDHVQNLSDPFTDRDNVVMGA